MSSASRVVGVGVGDKVCFPRCQSRKRQGGGGSAGLVTGAFWLAASSESCQRWRRNVEMILAVDIRDLGSRTRLETDRSEDACSDIVTERVKKDYSKVVPAEKYFAQFWRIQVLIMKLAELQEILVKPVDVGLGDKTAGRGGNIRIRKQNKQEQHRSKYKQEDHPANGLGAPVAVFGDGDFPCQSRGKMSITQTDDGGAQQAPGHSPITGSAVLGLPQDRPSLNAFFLKNLQNGQKTWRGKKFCVRCGPSYGGVTGGLAQPVQVMIKPWRDRVIMMTLTGPAGDEPTRPHSYVDRYNVRRSSPPPSSAKPARRSIGNQYYPRHSDPHIGASFTQSTLEHAHVPVIDSRQRRSAWLVSSGLILNKLHAARTPPAFTRLLATLIGLCAATKARPKDIARLFQGLPILCARYRDARLVCDRRPRLPLALRSLRAPRRCQTRRPAICTRFVLFS
ncbi:hypothetical protein C8J57DRAFT_1578813 [Mycena rebaudengoi]|nr:hypothetical protein C8J57DRAFT_1578813 [Mycena rebaudengoi]